MLTNDKFPVDKALILLSEIQAKIYENFPKIKQEEEEENLAGAKIYVSDICAKYTISDETDASPSPGPSPAPNPVGGDPQLKMQAAQERIRQEGIKLQMNINNPAAAQKVSDLDLKIEQQDVRNVLEDDASEGYTMRQKIALGFFVVACLIYIIAPIVDASS